MMKLEAVDLRSGYDSIEVLHGVSFAVQPGEIVAVLGANGAGKTTLLRTLMGLNRAQSGRVLLDGSDITKVDAEGRARVGLCLIPEGRAIYPSLTVRENIEMHVNRIGRSARAGVEEACTLFPPLRRRLDQTAGTMSGGEQQMVALSRAWLSKASVVMADELSTGLAPQVVDDMFASLGSLSNAGVSVIMVEQFAHKAIRLADRCIFLRKGVVQAAGPAADFRDGDLVEHYLGAEAV
ncbi:ABC transporter ATP-binding protein [Dactylosporangium sp. NPDC051484]|uniref:ABC transporter ATP-binding protein n=1 Tax=Dactylosporangium sp. NPDC051484 TaxID=3154942 RepID=UPI00344FDDE4